MLKKIAVVLVVLLAGVAAFVNNLMAKAAGVFMNMDKMVGGDFEKGLANLDAATAGVRR